MAASARFVLSGMPCPPMPPRAPFRNASSCHAKLDLPQLRLVLPSSSDAAHRALAAASAGLCTPDMQAVVDDLVYGDDRSIGARSQQRDARAARILRDGASCSQSAGTYPSRALHRLPEFACLDRPEQGVRRADDAYREPECVTHRQSAQTGAHAAASRWRAGRATVTRSRRCDSRRASGGYCRTTAAIAWDPTTRAGRSGQW